MKYIYTQYLFLRTKNILHTKHIDLSVLIVIGIYTCDHVLSCINCTTVCGTILIHNRRVSKLSLYRHISISYVIINESTFIFLFIYIIASHERKYDYHKYFLDINIIIFFN